MDWHKIFVFLTAVLQLSLKVETKAWCQAYGKACNAKYKAEMDSTFDFIEEMQKALSREIRDLDDIRHVMGALKTIRENEIKIDMGIGPIEVRLFSGPHLCIIIYRSYFYEYSPGPCMR